MRKPKNKKMARKLAKAPEPTCMRAAELREELRCRYGATEPQLRMASLFTGIGGFELGFEAAGFTTTFQCEISKFCAAILGKQWKTVPQWQNIREHSRPALCDCVYTMKGLLL